MNYLKSLKLSKVLESLQTFKFCKILLKWFANFVSYKVLEWKFCTFPKFWSFKHSKSIASFDTYKVLKACEVLKLWNLWNLWKCQKLRNSGCSASIKNTESSGSTKSLEVQKVLQASEVLILWKFRAYRKFQNFCKL